MIRMQELLIPTQQFCYKGQLNNSAIAQQYCKFPFCTYSFIFSDA